MRKSIAAAVLVIAGATAGPSFAGFEPFSGTRSNISPGGVLGGRCGADVLTVSFAPDAFAAAGTSNLGSFSYTASHCIAAPPPGSYFDGLFTWDFGDGTLTGSYTGTLTARAVPGEFDVTEDIVFTGGSGRFEGATGSAVATGILSFGAFGGGFASFGEVGFSGTLSTPVPEPATWALWLAAAAAAGATSRRRPRRGS